MKFCVGDTIFWEKEKKKENNGIQHQTRDASDTHATPLCRGC
jgi:hypothetical protein